MINNLIKKNLLVLLLISIVIVSGCTTTITKDNVCDYSENQVRKYIGKNQEVCSKIQFQCESSREAFSDNCGCGCELTQDETKTFCKEEQRNKDACIEIYQPVCGWYDSEKIQCIKYPCATTFSNSCFSCSDENVLYYTEGECPK
tara:strand:- start:2334 stop:2768 length:435 start_codon:yes stop_codon:yes gene_type:complete